MQGGVNEEVRVFLVGSALKDEHHLRKANHETPIADLDHLHELDTDPRLLRPFAAKRDFTCKGDYIDYFSGDFAVLDEQHFQGLD
ncbi:hypothetical protein QIS74_04902 [Colletotrichum tabaci]|uniref:Uncharacterized protein n=1 Tax=Colletotrichum tabaci TaxID=1209068 RepID=A0AAV9TH42_9PEZI